MQINKTKIKKNKHPPTKEKNKQNNAIKMKLFVFFNVISINEL